MSGSCMYNINYIGQLQFPFSRSLLFTPTVCVHTTPSDVNDMHLLICNFSCYEQCCQNGTCASCTVTNQPSNRHSKNLVHSTRDHFFMMSFLSTICCCVFGTWTSLFCTVPAIFYGSAVSTHTCARRHTHTTQHTHTHTHHLHECK